ncbi:MAG: hypothetical protein ACLFPQ_03030 [Candidatus Woesearchaeota archaeon]
MAKRIKWNNILKIVLILALLYVVAFHYRDMVDVFAGISEESSEIVARSFVMDTDIYSSGGEDLELININELGCRNCWEYTYNFKTRYQEGNHTFIEGHKINVIVNNRQIQEAYLDDETLLG